MRFQTKDGTTIYYDDWGNGQPVILIHGWPLSFDMWEYQSRALYESGMRVIGYDRRGFGRSDRPAGDYSFDMLASDLNDLINHLDLNHVSLVGFAMGSGEVARYIGRYGTSRINHVALISSILPYLGESDDNIGGLEQRIFEDAKNSIKWDRPKFTRDYIKRFYGVGPLGRPVSKALMSWTFHMATQGSQVAALRCLDSFAQTDFREDLKSFNVPTLIVHGEDDALIPVDISAQKISDLLPSAFVEYYPGAPHGLFATHKDQLNTDLIKFFHNQIRMNEHRFHDHSSMISTPLHH